MVPGIYFRLLTVGYFQGIDSERGIGWRASAARSWNDGINIYMIAAGAFAGPENIPKRLIVYRVRPILGC